MSRDVSPRWVTLRMRRQTEVDLPSSRRCVRGCIRAAALTSVAAHFLFMRAAEVCVMAESADGFQNDKRPLLQRAFVLKRCDVSYWLVFRLIFVFVLPVIIIGWRVGRFRFRLLLRRRSVRRRFAILLLASRLAAADVIYLLRLQRTSWVILHRALLLRKGRILLRWRIFGHQCTTVLRRAIRLTARILWSIGILRRSATLAFSVVVSVDSIGVRVSMP